MDAEPGTRRFVVLMPHYRRANEQHPSWQAALVTCLAFTWLNPHVYLDTVVLLGSVSSGYDGRRVAFAAGAVLASFSFFFMLGYGARLLRPFFSKPGSWRILDTLIGAVMFMIAIGLVRSA